MNIGRSHSVRSARSDTTRTVQIGKHRFAVSSFRGIGIPELSRKLRNLIKTQNHAIGAYEQAGRESQSVATQLSEWGESTDDDALSDISDKLGVLLAEIAEQEDQFAQNLEESRGILKQIRNTEASVNPTRIQKQKLQDDIQKLKYKEPESIKLSLLQQELVRAEAQSLVADAQLTNVTRQKFKQAYDVHTAAIIERAEKQIMLARHARRLINILDDTPIAPGEDRPAFVHSDVGKEILVDAELSLKAWSARNEPVMTASSKVSNNAVDSPIAPPNATANGNANRESIVADHDQNDLKEEDEEDDEEREERARQEGMDRAYANEKIMQSSMIAS